MARGKWVLWNVGGFEWRKAWAIKWASGRIFIRWVYRGGWDEKWVSASDVREHDEALFDSAKRARDRLEKATREARAIQSAIRDLPKAKPPD